MQHPHFRARLRNRDTRFQPPYKPHRPLPWIHGEPVSTAPRLLLDRADFLVAGLERRGESLVHAHWIVTFHKVDVITMTREQLLQISIIIAAHNGGAGNLVPVQV